MSYHQKKYVGKGGDKLQFALEQFVVPLKDKAAADLGCNIGGFTDCLLKSGATHVYAVDTGYGMLEWKLRRDRRVTVMERTNALHLNLPEKVDIVTIDVGWTTQKHILPAALKIVKESGCIMSLFKPQYEADKAIVKKGIVSDDNFDSVLDRALKNLRNSGIRVSAVAYLPRRTKRKNREAMLLILPVDCRLPN